MTTDETEQVNDAEGELTTAAKLAIARKARAELVAKVEAAALEQELLDEAAISLLEKERGVTNIVRRRIPYTQGLPVLYANRTPTDMEMNIYRHAIKEDPKDFTSPTMQLGESSNVYPGPGPLLEKARIKRPGLLTQLGTSALRLAGAVAENEGKA